MESGIACTDLMQFMASGAEMALIDIRNPVEFDRLQVFRSTNLPLPTLEKRISSLVPLKQTPIVLCDADGTYACRSARLLRRYGYARAVHLVGGLAAWQACGGLVVSGMYVRSKAFGERVAEDGDVPVLAPPELKAQLSQNDDITLIDVRPRTEVLRSGSVPGAINVPGVELIRRIGELRQLPGSIVVTCAGRTRGIIATQTLRMMGLQNVVNLEGGLMAWLLAGYERSTKIPEPEGPASDPDPLTHQFAEAILQRAPVAFLSPDELAAMRGKRSDATLYVLDVRTQEEFVQGHVPDSIWAPGGQMIQTTDGYIAVFNAKVVLVSSDFPRAAVTAYWLTQMGVPNVSVLKGGIEAWQSSGLPIERGTPASEPLGLAEALANAKLVEAKDAEKEWRSGAQPTVLDVGFARSYMKAHLPGAIWVSRTYLEQTIGDIAPDTSAPIFLACSDGTQSVFAALALEEIGYRAVEVLKGGTAAWIKEGLAIESGPTRLACPADDEWLSPYERGAHEMRAYLNWETRLLEARDKLTWLPAR